MKNLPILCSLLSFGSLSLTAGLSVRLSANVGDPMLMSGPRLALRGDPGRLDARALLSTPPMTSSRFTVAGGVQTLTTSPVPLPGRWRAVHGVPFSTFAESNTVHAAAGFKLVDVSVAGNNGTAVVNALWQKRGRPGFSMNWNATANGLANALNNSAAAGRRPVHLDGYFNGSEMRYFAIFEKWQGSAFQMDSDTSFNSWPAHFHARTNAGYRPLRIDVAPTDGEPVVVSLWDQRPEPAFQVSFGIDEASLAADLADKAQNGFRPLRLSGFQSSGQAKLNVIYEQRKGRPLEVVAGLDAAAYRLDSESRQLRGFRLASVAAYAVGDEVRYGAIWEQDSRPAYPSSIPAAGMARPELAAVDNLMTSLMREHQISASAICVSRNGTIVYERAFGWSDFQLRKPIGLSALLRVGSNSKPVTMAAIRKLESMGRLAMSDRVFNLGQPGGGILNIVPFGAHDARLESITVQNLVDHKGGWDRDVSGDIVTKGLTVANTLGVAMHPGKTDMVRWALGQVALDHDPGTTYAYSNFGYMLLGMIIEQITGEDATVWVRENVLNPAGVEDADFDLARTQLEDRNLREPWYFEPSDAPGYNGFRPSEYAPAPEGEWVTEFREVNGSWIFTPRSYTRFLQNYSLASGLPRSGGVAIGSHGGALPGSRSLVRQMAGDITYFYWFNQRNDATGNSILAAGFDGELQAALAAVNDWPTTDPASLVPPEITSQPQSQSIAATMTATFSVVATGPGTLSYQWRSNGVPVSGADAATFSVTNVGTNHMADYSVVVSNSAGSVTSLPAALMVQRLSPMLSWANPAAITYGRPLDAIQLNAGANTAGQFVYSPNNGTVLNTATGHLLSVNFVPSDTARYVAKTAGVRLDVLPAPLTITADDKTRASGATNPTLTYSMTGFVNGESAAVLDSPPSLSTVADTGSSIGSYPIVVTGGAAANYRLIHVNGFLIVTGSVPVLISLPSSRKAVVGNTVQFSVSASGSEPLSYQWLREGITLTGQTNAVLSFPAVSRAHHGRYRVAVSNHVGVVQSPFVELRVLARQRMMAPSRLPDGGIRLQFGDENGSPSSADLRTNFVIEASTDLRHWKIISSNGVGVSVIDGRMILDDQAASNVLRRYYRVHEK